MSRPAAVQTLRHAGYAWPVEGLGPGRRVVLWVRGCSLACEGCLSVELWAKGWPSPIQSLVEELLPALRQADGFTVSGGEPFEQPRSVLALVRELRKHLDVEVLIYTGYRLEELLQRRDTSTRALLQELDMLVDGRYEQSAANTKQWRGSDNQELHLLSERARRYAREASRDFPPVRELGLQLFDAGAVRVIGLPRRGDLQRLRAFLAARGLRLEEK